MSPNFLNFEFVDVRGITPAAFTTDISALASAALNARNKLNAGTVERLIVALQEVANCARELHI